MAEEIHLFWKKMDSVKSGFLEKNWELLFMNFTNLFPGYRKLEKNVFILKWFLENICFSLDPMSDSLAQPECTLHFVL